MRNSALSSMLDIDTRVCTNTTRAAFMHACPHLDSDSDQEAHDEATEEELSFQASHDVFHTSCDFSACTEREQEEWCLRWCEGVILGFHMVLKESKSEISRYVYMS